MVKEKQTLSIGPGEQIQTFKKELIEIFYGKEQELTMRIEATVKVTTRPVRTLIALGIKPSISLKTSLDPRVVLLMCTASNRSGIKFNMSSNILDIDDRFLNKGRCSIQLINPSKTIYISEADPLLLKLLLRTLRKVLSAKTNDELDNSITVIRK